MTQCAQIRIVFRDGTVEQLDGLGAAHPVAVTEMPEWFRVTVPGRELWIAKADVRSLEKAVPLSDEEARALIEWHRRGERTFREVLQDTYPEECAVLAESDPAWQRKVPT